MHKTNSKRFGLFGGILIKKIALVVKTFTCKKNNFPIRLGH